MDEKGRCKVGGGHEEKDLSKCKFLVQKRGTEMMQPPPEHEAERAGHIRQAQTRPTTLWRRKVYNMEEERDWREEGATKPRKLQKPGIQKNQGGFPIKEKEKGDCRRKTKEDTRKPKKANPKTEQSKGNDKMIKKEGKGNQEETGKDEREWQREGEQEGKREAKTKANWNRRTRDAREEATRWRLRYVFNRMGPFTERSQERKINGCTNIQAGPPTYLDKKARDRWLEIITAAEQKCREEILEGFLRNRVEEWRRIAWRERTEGGSTEEEVAKNGRRKTQGWTRKLGKSSLARLVETARITETLQPPPPPPTTTPTRQSETRKTGAWGGEEASEGEWNRSLEKRHPPTKEQATGQSGREDENEEREEEEGTPREDQSSSAEEGRERGTKGEETGRPSRTTALQRRQEPTPKGRTTENKTRGKGRETKEWEKEEGIEGGGQEIERETEDKRAKHTRATIETQREGGEEEEQSDGDIDGRSEVSISSSMSGGEEGSKRKDRRKRRALETYIKAKKDIERSTQQNTTQKLGRHQIDTSTIYDYSTQSITQTQKEVLALGKSFAPTNNTIDIGMLKADLVKYFRRIRLHAIYVEEAAKQLKEREQKQEAGDQQSLKDLRARPPTQADTATDTNPTTYRGPQLFHKPPSTYDPETKNRDISQYEEEIELDHATLVKHHEKTPDNIPTSYRRAIKQLQQKIRKKELTITQADKGGGILTLDYQTYMRKGTKYIQEEVDAYEKVDTPEEDLIKKITLERNKAVAALRSTGVIPIDAATYASHQITEKITGIKFFYKIHKDREIETMPLRPLQSSIGAPTQHLSQILTDFFKPYINRTYISTFIWDSNDLLHQVEGTTIPDTHNIYTSDVSALYPSIPHDLGLEAARTFIENNNILTKKTQIEAVIQALKIVITENYLRWGGNIYRQKKGVAMGTPVAVTYANIFMDMVDKHLLLKCPYITLHKRFIDDNLFTLPREKEKHFRSTLNTLYPPHIKYTVETREEHKNIPFLDLNFYVDAGRKLSSRLYTKETDTHTYLLPQSYHPKHITKNIPYATFLRIRRLCTTVEAYKEDALAAIEWFRKRRYNRRQLEAAARTALEKDRRELIEGIERNRGWQRRPTTRTETGRPKSYIPYITTYGPHAASIRKIVKDRQPTLDKALEHTAIAPWVIFRKQKNIADILIHPSLRLAIGGSPRTENSFERCNENNNFTNCPCKGTHEKKMCRMCHHAEERADISPKLERPATCNTKNVIYLIWCKVCDAKYVGETQQKVKQRLIQHLNNTHKADSTLYNHYKQKGHEPKNMRITILETVRSEDVTVRRTREDHWIRKLRTITPHGLNTKRQHTLLDTLLNSQR